MMTEKLGFVGAGQMAAALASGFVKSGEVTAAQLFAFDPSPTAVQHFQGMVPGCTIVSANQELVDQCDIIFIATKPQTIQPVCAELAGRLSDRQLVVSVAAGIEIAALAKGLGTTNIIRVMPNTPCLISKGAIGFSIGETVSQQQRDRVQRLLETVGMCCEVPETLLNVVTGLSGSGPAYVFEMIEALSDGAVRMGLPRQVATKLAAQTLYGAAAMVLETGAHPGALKDQVASPAGTTIAGLYALEKGALRGTLMSAVEAATRRSIELGQSDR
jgi:pyrroline-5-carboxylate reductase